MSQQIDLSGLSEEELERVRDYVKDIVRERKPAAMLPRTCRRRNRSRIYASGRNPMIAM